MKTFKAFSPAHITGVFQVKDSPNPLEKGSRGVGVTLEKGVYTELKVERSDRWKVTVRSVGARVKGEVSRKVVELLSSKVSTPHRVEIFHRFEVPVGAGYGASGAGALGVALAFDEALNLGLSPLEAANVAHVAEVCCGTGLGTVSAETWGGLVFRVKAGAPSLGVVKKIRADGLKVVSLCWGSLPTTSLLSNPQFTGFIREVGGGFLEKFEGNPTVEGFLEVSKGFSETLQLYSPRVRRALRLLEADGRWNFPLNMFGEAVFTLVEEEEVPRILRRLEHPVFQNCRVTVSGVSEHGARVES